MSARVPAVAWLTAAAAWLTLACGLTLMAAGFATAAWLIFISWGALLAGSGALLIRWDRKLRGGGF